MPVEDAPSGVAYRYRKWQLNEKRDAIVRTEVNGVSESAVKTHSCALRFARIRFQGFPNRRLES